MGLKKQLGVGVLSAALGLSLIGGGTYAYFSDTETVEGSFAAGTLELNAEPTEIIDIDNMQPGDSMTRDFELKNDGSLDIKSIWIQSDYDVEGADNDEDGDLGEHIEVEFLYNMDQANEVVYETTLAELRSMKPDAVKEKIFDVMFDEDGLEAGDRDDFVVKFNFVDDGEDQNQFQGNNLKMEWTFHARQEDGEDK